MPTNIVSVSDGPRTTVADLIGAPMAIPRRIVDSLANTDLAPVLLRDAGRNGNGLVSYSESDPIYLGSDVEEVAEFAEIPVAAGQTGLPRIAYATKKGLGVRVSREMRDENRIDDVNRQITQLTNTMQRARMRALRAVLTNPAIPTIAATAAWTGATAKVRRDISNAMEVVASAEPFPTAAVDDDVFGFEADAIVFPGNITPVLLDNPDFLAVYKDALAGDSIAYTGKMPNDVLGMVALKSRTFPRDRVLVLERKTVGFWSDTRPLEATGLYPEGNGPNGGPTETWRSDTTEKRALGADQPLAACWITGVQAA
jgi:hypothetical protein